MNLKTFYGKHVNIVGTNDLVFMGVVVDYFFPDDNENNQESIVIKTIGNIFYEFTEKDIKKITVIEKQRAD